MKSLENILLSTLLFLGCNTTITKYERELGEILLLDQEKICKLAFPDTLFYKILWDKDIIIKHKNREEWVKIRTYDCNFDKKPDLRIMYEGKYNELTNKVDIDSSKVPKLIFKWNTQYESEEIYFYNKKTFMYERAPLINKTEVSPEKTK